MFHVEQVRNSTIICPVCGNQDFIKHLELRDYFLTQEDFELIRCSSCGLIKTIPEPSEDNIGNYYKSAEYLSHATTSHTLKTFIYNLIRNKNLNSKKNLLNKYAKGKDLLDIGCATGVFLDYCKKHGYSVQGMEPNQQAREYAVNHYKLRVYDISETAKIPDHSIDIITLWHVLEHVSDLNDRMTFIYNSLRENGTAIIALPNPSSFDATYYGKFWAAYDVPRHLYHFSKETFINLADKHRFEVIDIVPMPFDAYYISLLSEKYKNGKESYLKAFFLGARSNIAANKNSKNHSSLIYILKKK